MSENIAFISYVLVPTGLTITAYSQAVHCNYFKKISLVDGSPYLQEISLSFADSDDFKFLTPDISNGTGYTVNEIHALVQIVTGSTYETATPDASKWKHFDITSQISGHTAGAALTGAELTSLVFKISLLQYENQLIFKPYSINYLNYPSKESTDDDKLCFGASTFFLGNVTTEITAIAYTTDLSINLPLGEFNTSSNKTWDEDVDDVTITEIGIYDANKNLVGIGKLNNPIQKNESIARTILFAIDF